MPISKPPLLNLYWSHSQLKVNRQIVVTDAKYGIFDQTFLPLSLLPILRIPKFCITKIRFLLETHGSCTNRSTCATKWIKNVGTINPVVGSDCPKTTWFSHIGILPFLGPPTYFFQPLKLVTSSLLHNLGSGCSMPK